MSFRTKLPLQANCANRILERHSKRVKKARSYGAWQVKSLIFLSLLCLLSIFGPARQAAAGETTAYKRRWGSIDISNRPLTGSPRVAFALSGGGARGLAHIGALQVCEDAGVEIAGIAGSSMGGIIGGLYAVGYTPDEIERIARKIDFSALFSNSPSRKSLFLTQREKMDRTLLTLRFNSFKPSLPTELSAAQRVTELFTSLTLKQNFKAGGDFTRLPTPFKTVATDISTGEAVTLDRGNLAEALRATMAFPLAISAVAWEDRLLMDGGMLKPAPVDIAKEFVAADPGSYTIAVNSTTELQPGASIDNPFAVAVQVTSIMSMRELDEQLALADFVITPDFKSLNGADFSKIDEFVAAGRNETEPVVREILAREETRKRGNRLEFDSLIITGGSPDAELLIEAINSRRTASAGLSEWALDSILSARYSRGDLWSISAKHDAARRTFEALLVSAPGPNALSFSQSDSDSDFDRSLREHLQTRYAAANHTPFDSLPVWAQHFCDSIGVELISFERFAFDLETERLSLVVKQGIASGLRVKGLTRTRPSYVRDRVTLEQGSPYSVAKAEATYRDLYGSGLFKRVAVDAASSDSGVIVSVQVEEDNSVKVKFGYHYHDEYHNEGLIEVAEDNLFGIGLRLGATGLLADRHKSATAGLSTDRFFRTYVAADINVYYDEIEPGDFDADGSVQGFNTERRRGAEFRLGQHISRFGFLSAALRIEEVGESFYDAPGENRYELRSFEIHSAVDDLDRTYFPRSGRTSEFKLETFGKVFGGETEFTRWQVSFREYFAITRRFNINARAFVAGSRSNLPKPEEFGIGGLDSFEGFRFEELSGAKAALFNLSARWEALSSVYLSAKYNAGNVYSQTDDISIDNLRHGWATSVGWDTPLGPIILSYGRAGEGRDRAHFHAGLKF